jgi:hypothetical protein
MIVGWRKKIQDSAAFVAATIHPQNQKIALFTSQ